MSKPDQRLGYHFINQNKLGDAYIQFKIIIVLRVSK
jgi:hypothetical protein